MYMVSGDCCSGLWDGNVCNSAGDTWLNLPCGSLYNDVAEEHFGWVGSKSVL